MSELGGETYANPDDEQLLGLLALAQAKVVVDGIAEQAIRDNDMLTQLNTLAAHVERTTQKATKLLLEIKTRQNE